MMIQTCLIFAELTLFFTTMSTAAVIVMLLFALLPKLIPYKHDEKYTPTKLTQEQFDKMYSKWEIITLIIFLLMAAVLFFIFWKVLLATKSWHDSFLPASDITFPFMSLGFMPPALFAAIFIGIFLIKWIIKYIMGDRFADYEYYDKKRLRYNLPVIFRWCVITVVSFFSLYMLLAYDCYLRATPQGLYDNPPFSVGEIAIPYADIDEIQKIQLYKAPNGELSVDPHTRIRYRGQGIIDLERGAIGLTPDQVQKLIDYIQKQRVVPIKQYELAPE